ncbi:SusD/RagB family nutrient-binding outer membrane lipoprotein [Ohtaekwangia sp.]|uniref:SusD/RagB family nutrient-binding outer membrane lipoprotein n=1 Tax=Ohtaekwangia sp. TaxID=2066019 RepID=UPI002FDEBE71
MRVRGSRVYIVSLLIAATIMNACRHELDERYLNPDRTSHATIDQFFTEMLNNNRVRPSYWEVSTFINWHIGIYTQSVGYLNTESVYQQNEAYISNYWDDFYRPGPNGSGVMAQYREIEKEYAALSADEQKEMEIFVQAARVVLYEETIKMVDLWGDIPFSEAGMLNKKGEVIYPVYDNSKDVYDAMLSGLQDAAEYFSTATPSTLTQSLFSRQDILLTGNIRQWQRYANSLRLRLLMRISFMDEARAKQEVQMMLSDPSAYPLLGDDNASYSPAEDDILLQPLTNYTDDLHGAFSDWTNYPAPYYMLEHVLKPVNDLRIPVLFDKYGQTMNGTFIPNAEYNGMPVNESGTAQQLSLEDYAILDSVTFLYNSKLPGVVMTVSEVGFLKAEAYERWGGGDAQKVYAQAVENSVDFYYYLNNLNQASGKLLAPPAEPVKEAFINFVIIPKYTGTTDEKLAAIATQKWLHLGFMQAIESWAELRRTGYPQLYFYPSQLAGYELPPLRLLYPASEKTFNSNYASVAAKDFRNSKIFWDIH